MKGLFYDRYFGKPKSYDKIPVAHIFYFKDLQGIFTIAENFSPDVLYVYDEDEKFLSEAAEISNKFEKEGLTDFVILYEGKSEDKIVNAPIHISNIKKIDYNDDKIRDLLMLLKMRKASNEGVALGMEKLYEEVK